MTPSPETQQPLADHETPPAGLPTPAKYLRKIYQADDSGRFVWADVYAVIDGYAVHGAARQHMLKKLLCAGTRGYKDQVQDLEECESALQRALAQARLEAGVASDQVTDAGKMVSPPPLLAGDPEIALIYYAPHTAGKFVRRYRPAAIESLTDGERAKLVEAVDALGARLRQLCGEGDGSVTFGLLKKRHDLWITEADRAAELVAGCELVRDVPQSTGHSQDRLTAGLIERVEAIAAERDELRAELERVKQDHQAQRDWINALATTAHAMPQANPAEFDWCHVAGETMRTISSLRSQLAEKLAEEQARLAQMAAKPSAESESDGVQMIAAERRRQQEAEGWTAEHDDLHIQCELAEAARCYLDITRPWNNTGFEDSWDKRLVHSYERRLTIAGALIAAEIDRVRRSTVVILGKAPAICPACGHVGSDLHVCEPSPSVDDVAHAKVEWQPVRQVNGLYHLESSLGVTLEQALAGADWLNRRVAIVAQVENGIAEVSERLREVQAELDQQKQKAAEPMWAAMTDEQIVWAANELARGILQHQGYATPDDARMWLPGNPRREGAWQLAALAFEALLDTDIHDALSAFEDDESAGENASADADAASPDAPAGTMGVEWEVVAAMDGDRIVGHQVRWSEADAEGRYYWVGHYFAGENGDPSLDWTAWAAGNHAKRFNEQGKRPEDLPAFREPLAKAGEASKENA